MSSLRLDLEVTTVEPAAGEMVYVEGRTEGAQVALYLAASAVRGSSLAVGGRLQLALELPAAAPAALPPLRERMGRPVATSGAPAPTRTPAQAPPRAAAMAGPRANAAPPRTDPSAVILSAILGKTEAEDEVSARDVEDEMDALFGRMKRE